MSTKDFDAQSASCSGRLISLAASTSHLAFTVTKKLRIKYFRASAVQLLLALVIIILLFLPSTVIAQVPPASPPTQTPTEIASITPTSPPTTVTATSTATPTTTPTLEERIIALEKEVDNLEKKPKDIWDILQIISGLISGVFVAIALAFINDGFNKRQRLAQEAENERQRVAQTIQHDRDMHISRIQTIQSFMPFLSSGDKSSVTAALLSIESLGDADLTTTLSTLYAESALEALLRITQSRGGPLREAALKAIEQIFRPYSNSIGQVLRDDRKIGTGFFADSEGHFITSAHVIGSHSENSQVLVKTTTGNVYRGTVVHIDRKEDIAIVSVEISMTLPLTITEPKSLLPLEQVAVINVTQDSKWEVYVGSIQGYSSQLKSGTVTVIPIEMTLPERSSGAPVINRDGGVVGVVYGYISNHNTTLVVPIHVAKTILEQYKTKRNT